GSGKVSALKLRACGCEAKHCWTKAPLLNVGIGSSLRARRLRSGLGRAAWPTHGATNQLEFKEAALQRAVEEWRSARRRQPDQLGQARVRREDVRAPAGEVALEHIAQARVERGDSPRVARPDAIRRVRDDDARSGWRLHVQHVGL